MTAEKRNRPTVALTLDPELIESIKSKYPTDYPFSKKVEKYLKAGLDVERALGMQTAIDPSRKKAKQ